MLLTDQLVAYYSLEENFDQAISAVNSVPPNSMPLHTVNAPGGGTGGIFTKSVAGKIGQAAEGYETASSIRLEGAEHAIAILNKDKTFCFWAKLTSQKQESAIVLKGTFAAIEYGLGATGGANGDQWSMFSASNQIDHPLVAELDRWYFVQFWWDQSANIAYLKIDDGVPVSGAFNVTLQPGTPFLAVMGAIVIDELGIWDRILTADELSQLRNSGAGMSYAEIVEASTPGVCRTLECCEDNPAEYVSQGGTGQGYDSACEPLPRVLFEPLSGTRLILPSLVTLRSDNPEAVIHYTTDGSPADANSPIYTGPLTVSSPIDLIRAVAIVDGCPAGPESLAQYQSWSPAAHFTYGCGTTDKSGQWAAFAADGNPDYNWQLQIQFSAITGIRQIDVLQLFPDGTFTGAGWSTKEFIQPWTDDPTKEFRAFPLVMWNPDHTGAQVNLAYQDDFSAAYGNFAVGPHIRTLYGSPWTSLPTTHIFKMRITFSDGSLLERLVDSTCDALPAGLCATPSFTATPQCGPPERIDITYSLTVGTPHNIWRRHTSETEWAQLFNGNVATSPQTYQDTAVSPSQEYDYIISNVPTGCAFAVWSEIIRARAIPYPGVGIAASPGTIDSGGSSTVSWTSTDINGNVTITPTIGVQPGNVPGNQVVSPAVTTTYIITGENVCGTEGEDSITVNVRPPATCGAVQPELVRIVGYSSAMFGSGGCNFRSASGTIAAWTGGFVNQAGTCNFFPPNPLGVVFHFGSDLVPNRELHITETKIFQSAGQWELKVFGYDPALGTAVLAWQGTKLTGDTPIGTYNRTSGCSSSPSSLIIVQV